MPGRRHAPSGDPALKTAARRALRDAIAVQRRGCEHPQCKWPDQPIDYTPSSRSRLAYDLDEIVPREHGGDPADPHNVRPTHRSCNRAAGARSTNAKIKARAARPVTATRW